VIDLFRYYGSDWVGMVFGLISTYYLAKERKRGFLFGVVGGLGWIAFGVLTQSVAGVLANAIFILFNCRGFWRWKEKQQEERPPPNSCASSSAESRAPNPQQPKNQ
jgi:nicotinamide riboside transporter PnuC